MYIPPHHYSHSCVAWQEQGLLEDSKTPIPSAFVCILFGSSQPRPCRSSRVWWLLASPQGARETHPRDLQQHAVDGLLYLGDRPLLGEVGRAQLAEVVVRVDVVQRQDEVDERPSAAVAGRCAWGKWGWGWAFQETQPRRGAGRCVRGWRGRGGTSSSSSSSPSFTQVPVPL